VQQVLDSSHVYPVINKLIQKKVCYVWEALKQGYSSKKEIYVLLNPEYNNEEKLSDLLNNWSRGTEANGIAFKLFAFYKNDR
jgi:primosomal protein N' (replication factor Y)